MYVCMYVCMYHVCVYIYIYIYTYTCVYNLCVSLSHYISITITAIITTNTLLISSYDSRCYRYHNDVTIIIIITSYLQLLPVINEGEGRALSRRMVTAKFSTNIFPAVANTLKVVTADG